METQLVEFQELCTFESFSQDWSHYGYGSDMQELLQREFNRMKGVTYLDHAGTTLFPESQIKSFYQDIARNVYGNPHSQNPSSRLTHDTVERVRLRILEHFNARPEEYSVIFTSVCTASLSLLAHSFPWRPASAAGEPGSRFGYLTDNHTSVVGIRGVSAAWGAATLPVAPPEVEGRARDVLYATDRDGCPTPHLFCYPAQSNFSGRKYPLSYVEGIQSRRLYPACKHQGRWFVLLDAAGFVGCSPLDLQQCPADFVPISFYKMFGFPTGLGALLVRNEAATILRKGYFGGGTAAAYLAGEDYFVPKLSVSSRFEDGTISFLDIISLHHGFEALHMITGSMVKIQLHTFGLARYTYSLLSCLRHSNREPVAQIYCDNEFQSLDTQGAVVTFNLRDCHGRVVGYSQVERLASLFNIHVRMGCFCNTGACQLHLGISNQEVKSNLQAGHFCGDNVDLVDGRPTGCVRVSFGYMSTFEDCRDFLSFIVNCFVEKPVRVDRERLVRLRSAVPAEDSAPLQCTFVTSGLPDPGERQEICPAPITNIQRGEALGKVERSLGKTQTLTNIFIYPIKSCAAFEVSAWPLGPLGLLYDRLWMVLNENGVALSQKREPRLCLIRPRVCLASNTLLLQASGMDTVSVPLEDSEQQRLAPRMGQSKVCGDRLRCQGPDGGLQGQSCVFLGKPCRLIRQSPDFIRNMKKGSGEGNCLPSHWLPYPSRCPAALSLVNEAQYLLISRASVCLLQERIISRQDSSRIQQPSDVISLIHRFRANLVVSGTEAFEEDDWSDLMIGSTQFQVAGRCGRCQMIGIDQGTAGRTQEPLTSLSACRQGKVTFGVYLRHQLAKNSNVSHTLAVGSHISPEKLVDNL